jgi:methylated-DNA-[protein]-cysteine S-methyltransferase
VYYFTFNTAVGEIQVLASEAGLLRVNLSGVARAPEFGITKDRSSWMPERFLDLKSRLQDYFAGKRVSFLDDLDYSGATVFQRKVWEAARLIPYGETRSYKWLAEQVGQSVAVRAVGQALGKNPLLIIVPCHRVLASNGGLGGFRGGEQMKRFLLGLEGVSV